MRRWLLLIACLLAGCNLAQAPTDTAAETITIAFQSPENQTTVIEGTALDVQLIARDPSGPGVARVEFTADDMSFQEGVPVDAPEVPVFVVEMNWLARGVGRHVLSAVAYRLDGTPSAPATLLVDVVAAP
jgi:hypothetical protein